MGTWSVLTGENIPVLQGVYHNNGMLQEGPDSRSLAVITKELVYRHVVQVQKSSEAIFTTPKNVSSKKNELGIKNPGS